MVQKWLNYFGLGDARGHEDIRENLRGLWSLSLQQMDQVRWLMASDQLQDWLGSHRPGMFVIAAETAPTEIHNPLSFTSAFLAQSLLRSADCLALSYFCGLRGAQSNIIDMLNSFNTQLLTQISHKRRDVVDLSSLGGGASGGSEWYRRKCRRSISAAVDLLAQLVSRLPDQDVVLILIDSASRFGCGIDEMDRGMAKLAALTRQDRVVVKILVSDPLRTCAARRLSTSSVSLPDFVDGSREGVNMEALEGDILPSLQATAVSMGPGFSSLARYEMLS